MTILQQHSLAIIFCSITKNCVCLCFTTDSCCACGAMFYFPLKSVLLSKNYRLHFQIATTFTISFLIVCFSLPVNNSVVMHLCNIHLMHSVPIIGLLFVFAYCDMALFQWFGRSGLRLILMICVLIHYLLMFFHLSVNFNAQECFLWYLIVWSNTIKTFESKCGFYILY